MYMGKGGDRREERSTPFFAEAVTLAGVSLPLSISADTSQKVTHSQKSNSIMYG